MAEDKFDPELCGLETGDTPLTHDKFNRWLRRAVIFHVRPHKKMLRCVEQNTERIETRLTEHMQEVQVTRAEIRGMIRATKIWVGVSAGLAAMIVSLVVFIVNNPKMLAALLDL